MGTLPAKETVAEMTLIVRITVISRHFFTVLLKNSIRALITIQRYDIAIAKTSNLGVLIRIVNNFSGKWELLTTFAQEMKREVENCL